MLAASRKSAFQRLQCLWLRASQELPTEAIAQAVGFERQPCAGRSGREYLRGGGLLARHQWRRVTPPAPSIPKTIRRPGPPLKELQAKVDAVAAGHPHQPLRLMFEDESPGLAG